MARETLALDIETYSEENLTKTGVYPYAAHKSFQILLLAYQQNTHPVQIIDLASGEALPAALIEALLDPEVEKHAFNAQFERVCVSAMLSRKGLAPEGLLDPEGWHCTLVHAAYYGLPLSLESCSKTLGLPQQKMTEGRALIKQFCTPQNPSLLDSGGGRREPASDPQNWARFKEYCTRDVEVETGIRQALTRFPLPETEQHLYWLDQRINDRGVRVDTGFVQHARAMAATHRARTNTRIKNLSGVTNPQSVQQLMGWLADRDAPLPDLTAQTVADLAATTADPVVAEVLALRQENAKSSIRKYDAMLAATHRQDQRARGLTQFYGATRTGRWAGRLIQVQNLPRNRMPDLDLARQLVNDGNIVLVEMLYPSVSDALSQLVRTSFTSPPGHVFVVSDFAAIEARVLAWLAGETWRLNLFRDGGDIYCRSAAKMFKTEVVKGGINGELRQKGKIAELSCGFGGGAGALAAMGALRMGLTKSELQPIVDSWRTANPSITRLWREVGEAAKHAITTGTTATLPRLTFALEHGYLTIRLPSGRQLLYPNPKTGTGRFGEVITYLGVNQTKRWGRLETYGAKLVENIVQATARDLLAHALTNLENQGFPVVMHVHDEAVIEIPDKGRDPHALREVTDRIARAMCAGPAWANGLPLDAEAYFCTYYHKD